MPIDFPSSPTNGQTYTYGSKTWSYNGSAWALVGIPVTDATQTFTATQTFSAGVSLSGASSPLTVNSSVGTYGQVLTSAGAGATPTWTTVSSGVSLTPSATQTIVAQNATTTPLIVKGAASQSVDLLAFQNSAGTVLSRFASNGALSWSTYTASQLNAGNGSLTAITVNAGVSPITAQGTSGQTADLLSLQNSSGTVLAKVTAAGQVIAPIISATTTAVVGGNVTGSTNYALQVKGNDDGTGAGADIMGIYDSTGALKVSVGASGYWNGGVNAGAEFVSGTNITANNKLQGKYLQLDAGTTTQAPILLTAGTNRTTPLAGAVEYDGTSVYYTPNSTSGRQTFISGEALSQYYGTPTNATDTFEKKLINNGANQFGGGAAYFVFFTPLISMTVSNFNMVIGSSSSTGTTRTGLYTYNGTAATLVARSAFDASLHSSPGFRTVAFNTTGGYPASYLLVAGQRYAIGIYSSNTSWYPLAFIAFNDLSLAATLPIQAANIGGQSDLAATYATASLTASRWNAWVRLT